MNLAFKRIVAFIFDMIILTILLMIVRGVFHGNDDTYARLSEESTVVLEELIDGKITPNQYLSKTELISYDMGKRTIPYSIVAIVIYILYYIVYQTKKQGQTLGKRIMNIRIVSSEGNSTDMNNMLIRSLIVNSIFLTSIDLLLLMVLVKDTYLNISTTLAAISGGVLILSILMMMFRKDGRTIHDIVAKTMVIDTKN